MTYVGPEKVFAHIDRLAAWQKGGRAAPVTVEWDLSNRCSLACAGCHFAHTHVRGPWALRAPKPEGYENTGDLADVDLVRRALREMAGIGVQGVVWSGGGEPTLNPAWPEIVAIAHHLGLEQGMYTLGGHLTPQTATILGAAATWVVVSLDAIDAPTYAVQKGVGLDKFERACEGISLLAAVKRATVGVSYLLHSGNWHQVEQMVSLSRLLGATYTTFRPLIEVAVAEPGVPIGDRRWIDLALPRDRSYRSLLDMVADEPDVEVDLDRFRTYRDWAGHGYSECLGTRVHATVTPDGRVWVCPQRRGMPGSCLGDLREQSFMEIWARHRGTFHVDGGCRAMCRLHQMNVILEKVFASREHAAFV